MLSFSLFLVACQPNQTETIPPIMFSEESGVTVTVGPATAEAESTTSPLPRGPILANCPIFSPDNIRNTLVDSLPTHPGSDAWIDSICSDESFQIDFGSGEWDGGPIRIPYDGVAGSTVQKEAFEFYYPDESDAVTYPLPPDPLIEYGSDHHILLADNGSNWYVSGAPDERWNNDMLHLLDVLIGDDFQAVDRNSGGAK